jgi:hypothetical protein
LISPFLSEASKRACDASFFEERKAEFGRANLLLSMDELRLGNVIGHGEFGGFFFNNKNGIKLKKYLKSIYCKN